MEILYNVYWNNPERKQETLKEIKKIKTKTKSIFEI